MDGMHMHMLAVGPFVCCIALISLQHCIYMHWRAIHKTKSHGIVLALRAFNQSHTYAGLVHECKACVPSFSCVVVHHASVLTAPLEVNDAVPYRRELVAAAPVCTLQSVGGLCRRGLANEKVVWPTKRMQWWREHAEYKGMRVHSQLCALMVMVGIWY